MKKILVLVVIVGALMAAGVLHFQKDGDEVNITINRARLREVSGELVDEGHEYLDEAQEKFEARRAAPTELETRLESEFSSQSRRFTPSRDRR